MNKKFLGAVLCILIILLAAIPTNADNLKGRDLKLGDKQVQQSVEVAFEYAEEELLPLDGIEGVSYTEEPARVIVYIESEEYRATVPDKIKGIKTEIRISGKFYALGTPLAEEMLSDEKTDEDVSSSDAVELTKEQLNEVYDSLEEIKEQDLLYYMVAKKALQDATTLTDDGRNIIIDMDMLGDEMQNYEAKLAPLINRLSLSKTTPILGRQDKVRPLVGGISCSIPWYLSFERMAGTLGGVTKKGFMLSNAHVFSMNRFSHQYLPGIPIIQPGSLDGGIWLLKSVAGRLVARSKIRWYQHNDVDAALAIVWGVQYDANSQLCNDGQSQYYVNFGATRYPNIGRTVRKSGRTTGVTTNEIVDNKATVQISYSIGKWAYFDNQILIDEPFVGPGDSGSVVDDMDGRWVGLIFAGGPMYAVANRAEAVRTEFVYLNLPFD